jgi:hypothetical protein
VGVFISEQKVKYHSGNKQGSDGDKGYSGDKSFVLGERD